MRRTAVAVSLLLATSALAKGAAKCADEVVTEKHCDAGDAGCVSDQADSACAKCATDFYPKAGEGEAVTCGACKDAIPNCEECSSEDGIKTTCTKCTSGKGAAGYKLEGNACVACGADETSDGKACKKEETPSKNCEVPDPADLSKSTPKYCKECNTETDKCKTCADEYTLKDDACTKNEAPSKNCEVPDPADLSKSTPKYCKECNTETDKCKTCADEYTLKDNACTKNEAPSSKPDCKTAVPSCIECESATKCKKCRDNKRPSEDGTACEDCPDGETGDGTKCENGAMARGVSAAAVVVSLAAAVLAALV